LRYHAAVWKKLLSWDGWSVEGFILWIVLSIGFGILFHYAASQIHGWWVNRKR
jgi:hypothetical protein